MKEDINIQNAVIVNGKILCSIDKYTKQSLGEVTISGGLVQFNLDIIENKEHQPSVHGLYLTTQNSIDEIMDKLLWGTVENDSYTYKYMKDLTESHLKNIIKASNSKSDKKATISPIHLLTAKMLLKRIWLTKNK